MVKLKDTWFTQNDIKSLLDNHTKFEKKWTLIYEKKDSALEHYIYSSIPIKTGSLKRIVMYSSWANDDNSTRKNIIKINGAHFLSLSIRRQYKLSIFQNEYLLNSKIVLAYKKDFYEGGTETHQIFMLTKYLIDYLRITKQYLLYRIRSHRYSERFLHEYGLAELEEECQSDRNNYCYNYKNYSNYDRPRANSTSLVFGKYIVK